MFLSGCCYPSAPCFDTTTDLIRLDWWQLWREHGIRFHTQLTSPDGREEECRIYSGIVGKGSEVVYQQCGDHRPRPTPSHLPGQRRPSLRWSAWANVLPGHCNKQRKVHKCFTTLHSHCECILSYLSESWGIAGREQTDQTERCSSELSLSGLHLFIHQDDAQSHTSFRQATIASLRCSRGRRTCTKNAWH